MRSNVKTLPFHVMLLLLTCSGLTLAQAPRNVGAPRLPTVPELEPRPTQGRNPQEQWRTQRLESERAPVAEFLDSLKGNDAAIQVLVNRTKLLTTKQPIAQANGVAVIAVSDPSILEFDILPNSRMLRLTGGRVGVTDLTFVTADDQIYNFSVHVGYDLNLLRAQLTQMFPGAFIRLGQIREHIVVEGQARSNAQIEQILHTIRLYLASASQASGRPPAGASVQPSPARGRDPQSRGDAEQGETVPSPGQPYDDEPSQDEGVAIEEGQRPSVNYSGSVVPQIINLLKIPGPKQVMLKVQIAELNRTALRQIGTDLFGTPGNNALVSIGGAGGSASVQGDSLTDLLFSSAAGTLVGVFDSGSFSVIMKALRQNNVATILAEPNLVALDGHQATFLSGGEVPVQSAQAGGNFGVITTEYKDFGVHLAFVPYILADGVIRLHVEPEVNEVAEELSFGGVPGFRKRNASTTVEMREGQTLAIAGLLTRQTRAETARIPILGDLPYLGPFFSNSKHQVVEEELIVAVTPYLVEPTSAAECLPLPGTEIDEPNDLEFYLLQRIEGRVGRPHRSTTNWDDPFHRQEQMQLEQHYFTGSVGFTP
jgi:pilus assembly protein CpaC